MNFLVGLANLFAVSDSGTTAVLSETLQTIGEPEVIVTSSQGPIYRRAA